MSVKSVLSGMDWDEGLQVPVANESNKQLESLVSQSVQICHATLILSTDR